MYSISICISLKIQVKQINGSAKDTLQYKEAEDASEGKNLPWEKRGIHIIAVGGDKLSRGLTLEGLTISYYLRASTMYDTLMQMGRWFGYRPGYLDLCRINTTSDLMENFAQIATAEKDLIEQFREMARSGATPEECAEGPTCSPATPLRFPGSDSASADTLPGFGRQSRPHSVFLAAPAGPADGLASGVGRCMAAAMPQSRRRSAAAGCAHSAARMYTLR